MIILDLDNTIADDSWRMNRIDWDNPCKVKRFSRYHRSSIFDKHANSHLWEDYEDGVIIATARPESFSGVTQLWLERIGLWEKVLFCFFRPNDCFISSPELKSGFLDDLETAFNIDVGSAIHCAYDDRKDVIDMYRKRGVEAKQVQVHNVTSIGARK